MERITQIINDWDPIGFFPMAPKDEYINEIKKINLLALIAIYKLVHWRKK